MHDEPQVGLVEPHAERTRGDQGLQLVALELLFELLALVGVGAPGVRADGVPVVAQQPGDVLGRRDRERVDDAAAGQVAEVGEEPPQPLPGVGQGQHAEAQGLAGQGPADREHRVGRAGGQLLGDVLDHALVRRRGGGQDGDAVGERPDELGQTPVVRPEVVAPVRDAVRFVDHEHAHPGDQGRHLLVAELRVVQALGGDEEHVDLVTGEGSLGLTPLVRVRGVDRHRTDPGPRGSGDLVAHQGEQRRHQDRRATPAPAQQQRRQEVHRRLAPPGALDDEGALPVLDQRGDRLELAGVEHRVGAPRERSERLLRLGGDVRRGGDGRRRSGPDTKTRHAPMLSAPTDETRVATPGCGQPDQPGPTGT